MMGHSTLCVCVCVPYSCVTLNSDVTFNTMKVGHLVKFLFFFILRAQHLIMTDHTKVNEVRLHRRRWKLLFI